MRQAQALRFISLPVAASLAVALVVACSNDSPTAPQKFNPGAPTLAVSFVDNESIGGPCPNGYKTVENSSGSIYDVNNDGITCRKGGGGGKKKPPKK
jgi:hypothetical protein